MSMMAAGIGGLIGIGAHMVLPSGLGDASEEVAALNDRIGKLEQSAPDDTRRAHGRDRCTGKPDRQPPHRRW
jgi:hypothetical protein